MAEHSKIEWTDATWNPITGCSIDTPGCINCYAMKLAGTRLRNHPSRAGLTRVVNGHHVWTGEVRLNEQWLTQPLQWKRPRMVFVCAHGDLFHENVPDEWIDRVFAVMALASQHTFQVLTKRSERMREAVKRIGTSINFLQPHARNMGRSLQWSVPSDLPSHLAGKTVGLVGWPLPNVWLGISAERQQEADRRVPHLLDSPAAVRFASLEPLIGPVQLPNTRLDWLIVGAESGDRARPMDLDWARSIRDTSGDHAAIFIKQLSGPGGRAIKDFADFPADLRIRDFPKNRARSAAA